MGKSFERKMILALVVSLVLTQPFTVLASETADISVSPMAPVVDAVEADQTEETEILAEHSEADETEADALDMTGAEVIEEEEAETDLAKIGGVSDLDSSMETSDYDPKLAVESSTVTDCFGHTYTYDPENWYKTDYKTGEIATASNDFKAGFRYKIDADSKRITLLGSNTGYGIREDLYIPAKTTIDGEEYTTQFYFGDKGSYSSPFVAAGAGGGVKYIYIAPGVEVLDGSKRTLSFGVFENLPNLISVDMTGVDLSNVSSFKDCFSSCESLQEVSLGKNINKATNCDSMFKNCTSLTHVDLSAINTSKVEDAAYMFWGCTSLKEMDFSGNDLSNVTSMQGMFYECPSLASVNLSGSNLSSITNMSGMFKNCTSLVEFEFPETYTPNLTTIEQMFYGCTSLKVLKLHWLDTDNLEDIGNFIDYDLALEHLWLPYGMEKLKNAGYSLHDYRGYLPKDMYHGITKCESGKQITSEMSGWQLQSTAKYEVGFDTKGGSIVFSQVVDEGECLEKPDDPTRNGYLFKGWYKDEAYTQLWDFASDKVTKAFILYARWSTLYTINFNAMGGSEVVSQTVEEGTSIQKPADPVRTGYTFKGWYQDEACTQIWNFTSERPTSNITLYAKWIPEVFDLTKDIWSFANYSHNTDPNYPLPLKLDQNTLEDILDLADGSLDGNCENTERAKTNCGYIRDMIDANESNGHCQGIAQSAIANFMGYQNIASNLFSVTKQQGDPIINAFHVTQCLWTYVDAENNFEKSFPEPADKTNQVISVASNIATTGPAFLAYEQIGWGAHAVVLYGMEAGSFTSSTTQDVYDIRLNVYDSNAFDESSGKYNDPGHDYDIYVNSSTLEWEVPAYYSDPEVQLTKDGNYLSDDSGNPVYGFGKLGSQNGADFKLVSTDEIVISPLTFVQTNDNSVGGSVSNKNENFVGVGSDKSLQIQCGTWEAVANQRGVVSSSSGKVIADYDNGYVKGQYNTSPLKVYLPDDIQGGFSIKPASGSKGEIKVYLLMGKYYVRIEAEKADSVNIAADGSFGVEGNEGKIDATLTSGLMPEGQYDTFSFSGISRGDITLSLNAAGGAKISGSDLAGLKIGESDGWNIKEVLSGPDQKVVNLGGEKDKPGDDSDDDIPENAPDGIWISGLKSAYPYTGSAIKPEFKVYRGKTRLYEKTDYTLQYKNNTKPGPATVTIKMKGNYSGSKSVTFGIEAASLKTDITADTVYVAYKKNKLQKPVPVLYINGAKLKYGKNDLEFTYPSTFSASENKTAYMDPGTYRIHVAPKNTDLFKKGDEMDVDLVIAGADKPLMSAVSIKVNKSSLPYDNGNPVSPVFKLTYKNQTLSENDAYTVRYEDDHTRIGKHKVTFTGNNVDYFGTKTYTFSITGKYDLTSDRARVKLDPADLNSDGTVPYTNDGAKPGAVVTYDGVKLTEGKDYTISYANHKTLGAATATIKGKGSYKGSVPVEFTVTPRDINTISPNIADRAHSTKANDYKKTSITFVDSNYKDQKLKAGRDYTMTISGNYEAAPAAGTEIQVTLEGTGNYTGTIQSSYRIIDKKYDFTKAKVVVNGGKAYDYTGGEIRPSLSELKVTIGKDTLSSNNIKILGYYNNIRKGNSAYIRLQGQGDYAGVKVVKFKIGAAPIDRIWSEFVLDLQNAFAW